MPNTQCLFHMPETIENNKKLIVIGGPTAVGKTSLAIGLAQRLGTEILSADSRQVFIELNIGTAKPSPDELRTIPHHFINIKSVQAGYDAAQFERDALALIEQLFKKYTYVILCGGSGLYIKAVCEGLDDIPEIPEEVRDEIVKQYEKSGLPWLQGKMEELDPAHFSEMDRQNPHRLIRALEVRIATGKSIRDFHGKNKMKRPFAITKIGLELERTELYKRIDDRMDQMIEAGLFEEARSLYPLRHHHALQTVGYQEIFDFMEGKYDREEAVRLLKRNSRRYAKRQLTWFRRDRDLRWFHPQALDEIYKAAIF
jgi:tRNA dimethylallyltransferase